MVIQWHKYKVKEPFLKRPLDIILSSFMLIVSLPVSVLIALAIKLEDGGSILYRQERWGRDGSHLRAYKFRTMAANSDQEFGIKQAKENDPRIIRVGQVLRSMGLDELPQLLNIFRGEMSFVGPRSLAVGEIVRDEKGGVISVNYFFPLTTIIFPVTFIYRIEIGSERREPGGRDRRLPPISVTVRSVWSFSLHCSYTCNPINSLALFLS